MERKRFLEAGRITGTHGLEGEVRVQPWCDAPEFLLHFGTLYLDAGKTPMEVAGARVHKGFMLAHFRGIDGMDAAKALSGRVVFIDRSDIELPAGSYFEQDLIGLEVCDAETGALYGRLTDVLRTGRNDVYTVQREGAADVLIPAIPDVVRTVDLEAGRMLITPLKGLFDDAD